MSKITVIKRNGSFQDFDKKKVAHVCMAAGLNTSKCDELAQHVEDSFVGKEKVTSLEIRDKVVTELEKVDPKTAGFFKWYQKMKDKGSLDGKIY